MYEQIVSNQLPENAVEFLQCVCRIGQIDGVIALEDMKNTDTNNLGNGNLVKQFNSMLQDWKGVGDLAKKLYETIKYFA